MWDHSDNSCLYFLIMYLKKQFPSGLVLLMSVNFAERFLILSK